MSYTQITEMPTELESDEAARPLITITPGPHAIILCFRCEQFFSPEDYYSYSTLKKWLGSHFSKYVILCRTEQIWRLPDNRKTRRS